MLDRRLFNEIRNCMKCRLYTTRKHAMEGKGYDRARLFFVAQSPGENEDAEGIHLFPEPAERLFDKMIIEAGLNRKEIFCTYLIKCLLPRTRGPKPDEIEKCSEHLLKELEFVGPDVIVPLGYHPTKFFLESYGLEVPAESEFNRLYGRLQWNEEMGKTKVFPLPNPVAAKNDGSLEQEIVQGYRKLRVLRENCKWYMLCPLKEYYDRGMLDRKWVELYCAGDWESCVRFKKEESGEPHPDNMLPDGSVDEKLGAL